MEKRKLRELQDPASWDADGGETMDAVREPKALVSVQFSPAEFEEIAGFARRAGMKTSEFIRQAALQRAHEPGVIKAKRRP